MKTMTCKELGGACDLEFHANTFEEIAQMSQKHGKEMFQKGDNAHLQAMSKMRDLMQSEDGMAFILRLERWQSQEQSAMPPS
jgi:predicted small metal-binding protein